MADTVLVSNSAASSNPDYRVWTDELVDPVSGLTVQKQIVGLVDATAGGTTRAAVGANGLAVSATIVGTVPVSLATLPVTNAGTFAVQNTSVIPGTGATNLGKAEDAAAGSGDTGVMALAVRNDAGTPLAASGDYIPLMVNASGALYVTGGGGGTQYVEDTASAGGETMTLAGVVRQNTLASSTSADGDYAYLKVNANGALYTETTGAISVTGTMAIDATHLEDAVAASGDTGIPALAVRRDSASAGGADGDYVNLSTDSVGALRVTGGGGGQQYAEDVAHVTGDLGTGALVVRKDTAAQIAGTDGDYSLLINDASGRVHVNVGTSALPTGASTAAKQPALGTAGASSTDVITIQGIASGTPIPISGSITAGGTMPVAGDVAHDAADSGNPVKIGGKARSADITNVASGDRTDLQTDLQGRVITSPYTQPESLVSGTTGASPITNTTSTAVIAAGGAGIITYLTQITITNGHATVSTRVDILDGSTIKYTVWAQAAGGGAAITLPAALRGTANTAWNAQPATTGSSINVSLSGYQSKE